MSPSYEKQFTDLLVNQLTHFYMMGISVVERLTSSCGLFKEFLYDSINFSWKIWKKNWKENLENSFANIYRFLWCVSQEWCVLECSSLKATAFL